jgi:MFS family permease
VIAIAATLPILIAKWQLTPWEIGFLIGSGSVGQLIGAFVFPWYAERKGRVKAIALSSGIIGITSIACGFAPTFAAFVVLRVIQGLGLGGELPVAATYINEISRAHGRGRFVCSYMKSFSRSVCSRRMHWGRGSCRASAGKRCTSSAGCR